ncbi:MAG: hypothetical protein RLZ55_162 [Actinomycetota bacterium]
MTRSRITSLRRACVPIGGLGAALMVVAACGAGSVDGAGPTGSGSGQAGAPSRSSPSLDSAAASQAEQAQAGAPGPYAVGRRTITVTDPARNGRTLATDIWYPVDPAATGGAAPSEYEFLPGLGYTSEVSLADAPAAKGTFPLLVYSHGGGGFSWVATFFTEFMASKGYVVVAPNHTGNTALDAITGSGGASDDVNANNRPSDVTVTLDTILAANDDPADPLTGIVDASRIAVSGHSWGGFTSLATISGHATSLGSTPPDPRVSAIVLMAPYAEKLSPEELAKVDVPVLVVSSTGDTSTPIETDTVPVATLVPGRPLVRLDIDGGAHASFTDACALREAVAGNPNVPEAVLAELDRRGKDACAPGVLDSKVIQNITNSYSAAFLATQLSGSTDFRQMLACVAPPEQATCTDVK